MNYYLLKEIIYISIQFFIYGTCGLIKEEFYKAIRELEEALEDAFLDNNIISRERFIDAINLMNIVTDDCYATLEEIDHENEYEIYDE